MTVILLGWLLRLLEFLHRVLPSLHLNVHSVKWYDVRNVEMLIEPYPTGWEVDVEVSNRGQRRTTAMQVTLVVGGRTLDLVDHHHDWAFDPGDARRMLLTFPDRPVTGEVDRYQLRMRDSFGKVFVAKGAPSQRR